MKKMDISSVLRSGRWFDFVLLIILLLVAIFGYQYFMKRMRKT